MKIEDYLKQTVSHIITAQTRRFFVPQLFWKSFCILIKLPLNEIRDKKKSPLKKIGPTIIIVLLSLPFGRLVILGKIIHTGNNVIDGVFNILIVAITGVLVLSAIMTLLLMLDKLCGRGERLFNKTAKFHRKRMSMFEYTDYKKAAEVLEKFRPIKYEKAIEKYGNVVVDILILSNSVYVIHKKLKRIVSLNAIRENREVAWED